MELERFNVLLLVVVLLLWEFLEAMTRDFFLLQLSSFRASPLLGSPFDARRYGTRSQRDPLG